MGDSLRNPPGIARESLLGWTARREEFTLSSVISVERILVPIDFSPHADAVVEWAAHLALEHDSEIVLLHAYHLPVEFQQLEGAYLPADFWANVKEEAMGSLKAQGELLRAQGISVSETVREGYPASVIEEEACRQKADLIVIGCRGLSGLKHLLLGSIAERVVQRAPCPVLTVKTPD
jgi:nucleotide-binding universal stress UspA family protein